MRKDQSTIFNHNLSQHRGVNVQLAILLLLVTMIYVGQNFVKYGDEQDYNLVRSFVFNLITLGGFLFITPLIIRFKQYLNDKSLVATLCFNVLGIILALASYAVLVAWVLYFIDYLSTPWFERFYLKYVLNMSIIHVIIYLIIVIDFKKKAPELGSVLIDVTKGRAKVKISVDKVVLVEAMDHYMKIHGEDALYLKKSSASEMEKLLTDHGFVRVHRSYIVNTNHICQLERTNGSYDLTMSNNLKVRIGKTYVPRLKANPSFAYL